MISPLRVAGSRLTGTTIGRAMATNSTSNAKALHEEEHEAVRQHLEAMGHQHLECRQPMLFRSSPINTQRVLQQDSQSGIHLQSIRSFSTSQRHPASMTSQTVMSQEADEDIHTLHNEAMHQRSHEVSALKKFNGSLIIKQRPLMRQNRPSQLDSQFQSVRTFHTQQCQRATMNPNSAIGQAIDADVHKIHSEAMEQRSHQVASLNQMKSSLITNKSSLQRQTSPKHLDLQFQSVRSLHTNVRMPEFIDEDSASDIISLHNDTIESRQQKMKEVTQLGSSLITKNKSTKNQHPQFQSVRSLHTNVKILDFTEVPEESDILNIHSEAIDQRQHHIRQLSQISSSIITNKMDSAVAKDKTHTLE